MIAVHLTLRPRPMHSVFAPAALLAATLALIGCGLTTTVASNGKGPTSSPSSVSGHVHGGQQPVSGAAVYLFAASTTYYGTPSTSLLNTAATGVSTDASGNGYVTSDAAGNFSITGDYTCPSGALVYALATGGNPGLAAGTINPNLSMLTALGPCSALGSSTFISINELTTVASVWALAPFMQGTTSIGTSPTNVAGLANAFAAVNELVNTASGYAPGTGLPAGAVLPVAEMNTIADILAACINSSGGFSGDGTPCGTLFLSTFGNSGFGFSDTASVALFMARNPAVNVSALFGLSSASGPFQPTLVSTPADWTLAVQYNPAGLSTPKALAIDAAGNIWIANCGSANCTTPGAGSVTELANSGALIGSTSADGLNIPYAIAIDLTGNAWVANFGGNSVTKLNASLAPVAAAYTGGGLASPNSLAIDNTGNVWLTNANSNVLSEFSSAGVALPTTTVSGLSSPVAIAINPH
jgi:hypothetical protein